MFPHHHTSMTHDVEKHIRQRIYISTEIDELDVYLCLQAIELGISVPTTSFMVALFTSFSDTYNLILNVDNNEAETFAKCFLNQNAVIIGEEPLFKPHSQGCIPAIPIFEESNMISQSFLRLYGEYMGTIRQPAGRTKLSL